MGYSTVDSLIYRYPQFFTEDNITLESLVSLLITHIEQFKGYSVEGKVRRLGFYLHNIDAYDKSLGEAIMQDTVSTEDTSQLTQTSKDRFDVQQLSLYELALQRKQSGEPPFHEEVLIYHPANREFTNELREIGQKIYYLLVDEVGTLKELKRDERSQELSRIVVDFPKHGIRQLIINSRLKYDPHIWGEPKIYR